MPAPRTPATAPGRRAVLRAGLAGAAALGVLATAGCRLRVGSPSSEQQPVAPERTADQLAIARAAAWADQLSTQYADAARVRPDLAPTLRQLGADHSAHSAALRSAPGAGPTGSPTSSSNPSPSGASTGPSSGPSSGPSTTPPALTPATVVSSLAEAERSAATATLADLGPTGPDAARLLASIAACRSAHLAVLAGLPAGPRPARATATSTKQAG